MSHFCFPAHETVLLSTMWNGRLRTAHHHNSPINLDLVLTFHADTDRYDFSSHEANRKPEYGIVPAIRFQTSTGTWYWLFGDEPSRDAELRALATHLVNKEN